MAKSTQKQRGRPFTGKEGNTFSSENQPSGELKSQGWAKRRTLKQLLSLCTLNTLPGSDTEWRTMVSKCLNIPEDEVTVANIMEFRQIEKAIKKGDTSAFNAVMDRAFGRPKPDEDEKPVAAPEERQRSAIDMGNGVIIYIG